jgi:hypothetical protein
MPVAILPHERAKCRSSVFALAEYLGMETENCYPVAKNRFPVLKLTVP